MLPLYLMNNACLARSVFQLVELTEEKKDLQSFKIMKIIQWERKEWMKTNCRRREFIYGWDGSFNFSLSRQQLKLFEWTPIINECQFYFSREKTAK